jgi:hypothetical protein
MDRLLLLRFGALIACRILAAIDVVIRLLGLSLAGAGSLGWHHIPVLAMLVLAAVPVRLNWRVTLRAALVVVAAVGVLAIGSELVYFPGFTEEWGFFAAEMLVLSILGIAHAQPRWFVEPEDL